MYNFLRFKLNNYVKLPRIVHGIQVNIFSNVNSLVNEYLKKKKYYPTQYETSGGTLETLTELFSSKHKWFPFGSSIQWRITFSWCKIQFSLAHSQKSVLFSIPQSQNKRMNWRIEECYSANNTSNFVFWIEIAPI